MKSKESTPHVPQAQFQQALVRLAFAWLRIESEPFGCPNCDSGKLRNSAKPHWDTCGFALMQKAVADLTAMTTISKSDAVCVHGTALDVHCCNCHSGFIFDVHHECPATEFVDKADEQQFLHHVEAKDEERRSKEPKP